MENINSAHTGDPAHSFISLATPAEASEVSSGATQSRTISDECPTGAGDRIILAQAISQLQEITEQIGGILPQLNFVPESASGQIGGAEFAPTGDHIRQIQRARRRRAEFFPTDFFADPAWDMLLDLYQAYLSGARVSVTSLCAASNVPATTALRWIKALEAKQLIVRGKDPSDSRRTFLMLSETAKRLMDRYLESLGDWPIWRII